MPSTIQALMIFALVLVPGFLFMIPFRRSVSNLEHSDLRFLLATIPAGALTHVLVFLWTVRLLKIYLDDPHYLLRTSTAAELVSWAFLTIFLLPISLGTGLGLVVNLRAVNNALERIGYGYINLLPSAWEYVFDKREGYYVRIHLKDGGGLLGGVYSIDSFAADPPQPSDIYIEQVWLLDDEGNFLQPLPTTRGAWVSQESIAYIEFFEGREDSQQERINDRKPET